MESTLFLNSQRKQQIDSHVKSLIRKNVLSRSFRVFNWVRKTWKDLVILYRYVTFEVIYFLFPKQNFTKLLDSFAICIVLYVCSSTYYDGSRKKISGEGSLNAYLPTSKKKWWNVRFFSYKPTTICQKKMQT